MDEAEKGEKVVLFMDAAHFIFATFLGYIWASCRYFMKSHAGRKRYNVLGAVNAINKKVSIFTNDTTLNAKSVCIFLKQLYIEYCGKDISIILDNARYQRCKLVMRYAKVLGIELVFLPSYSPNLNLIERFWKYVKKKVLYTKFYKNYSHFKSAINHSIENAHTDDKEKLKTLLSLKFQSFENIKILPY